MGRIPHLTTAIFLGGVVHSFNPVHPGHPCSVFVLCIFVFVHLFVEYALVFQFHPTEIKQQSCFQLIRLKIINCLSYMHIRELADCLYLNR